MSKLNPKFCFLIVLGVSYSLCLGQSPGTFVDVTNNVGINANPNYPSTFVSMGSGASLVDYDGDDDIDIYFVVENNLPNQLYENDGTGNFTEVAQTLGIDFTTDDKCAKFADFDNDGDKDFFLTSTNSNCKLMRNDGNGAYTDITSLAGIPNTIDIFYGCAWGDYDNDGFLDLYVCVHDNFNKLFHNEGNGTFTEVATQAGVADSLRKSFESIWLDYDNDNDLDLYISNDKCTRNSLYRNEGNGTFTDVSVSSGADVCMDAMGIASGDYNNDGFLDIYITNTPGGNAFLHNNGNGTFNEVANSIGAAVNLIGWGTAFFDFDNDQDEDLYVTNFSFSGGPSPQNVFLENNGGNFTDVTSTVGLGNLGYGFGLAIADYNDDGAFDVFVTNRNAPSVLYKNIPSEESKWLKFKTVGTVSNRDGIGARIRVVTGSVSQIREVSGGSSYLSQHSLEVGFGLGTNSVADSVIVTWPSGIVTTLTSVSANQTLRIYEAEIRDLEISQNANDLILNWGKLPGVTNYKIYRSNSPNNIFQPTNLIGTLQGANTTTFTDSNILGSANENFYLVTYEH